MWFWPFCHHVTDTRHVSPTTGALANIGTFTFIAICYPFVGIQYFLWGIGLLVPMITFRCHFPVAHSAFPTSTELAFFVFCWRELV